MTIMADARDDESRAASGEAHRATLARGGMLPPAAPGFDQIGQNCYLARMAKKKTYSLYEAKTQLSAIVRRVREGDSVVVTVHGKPVAEIRPIPAAKQTLEERIVELTAKGIITPAKKGPPFKIRPVARRPGALKRFLDERD